VTAVLLRCWGGAACLLVLFAGRAAAQADPVQAWMEGGAVVAYSTGPGVRLALPEGRRLDLSVPAGGEAVSLAGLGQGWAAAGTYVAADGRLRLWVLAGDRQAHRALPEPPGQLGSLRRRPVLLVRDGRLLGLAWLEGDGLGSLAVRAAAWQGGRWGSPERVSAVGPGSQLALAGAALADGSWLLAWSAFDGEDDEVVWARRVEGRWRAARRLAADNRVPDITPALVATTAGALAAWSRFDGSDYRLQVARFADGRWEPEGVVGGPGSLHPSFGGEPGSPHLLYSQAFPGGWVVARLDEAGAIEARGTVWTPEHARPIVLGGPGGSLRLRWPAARQEAILHLQEEPR
jgi:hypothetical protein